jgi:hypothetical protein
LSKNYDNALSWLEEKEWAALDAAYILANLDPEISEPPSGNEDWLCYWICRDPDLLNEAELKLIAPRGSFGIYERDQNLSLIVNGLIRRTTALDPNEVRAPRQWLEWAARVGVAPSWLLNAAEQSFRDDQSVKPSESPFDPVSDDMPLRDHVLTPSPFDKDRINEKLINPISKAGGKARHEKSRQGKMKNEFFLPAIRLWLENGKDGFKQTFINKLIEEGREHPKYAAGEYQESAFETISGWVTLVEKRQL